MKPIKKHHMKTLKTITSAALAAIIALASATSCCNTSAKGGKAERVIIMTFDGISIEGFKTARTPNLDALMARGAASLTTRDQMPSITLPNYTSHLLGCGPEIHGVADNSWQVDNYSMPALVRDEDGYFPSVFQVLKENVPDMKTGFFHDWINLIYPYNPKYFDDTFYIHYAEDSYPQICDRAWEFILKNRNNPTFAFVYGVWTDEMGHKHQWMSPEYIAAVEAADAEVGRMVERLEESGMLESTNFMFISDHGGTGYGHGGVTETEMVVPWMIAGPDIKEGFEITEPNNTVNTAATVLHLFGVEEPDCWTGEVPMSIYR